MSEQNKTLIREMMDEVWQNQKIDSVDQYYSEQYVNHNAPPDLPPGLEGLKAFAGILASSFTESSITIEDQISEGDIVVTRWSSTSKHTGDFMGVPASGNQIELTGIDVLRISEGKIVEGWGQADMLGLMQQIGAIPPPGA